MRDRFSIPILISLILLFTFNYFLESSFSQSTNDHTNTNKDFVTKNTLSISYANNVASSYEVLVDSNEKYTVTQSYSWVRDQTSRYNLVSYSVDGDEFVQISRKPRGNFTLDFSMDSPHTVVFLAVPQYPISVEGLADYTFSPISPTGDNWFDANSKIIIHVPTTLEITQGQERQQLGGWSLDNSDFQTVPGIEFVIFNTPEIHMTDKHSIEFTTVIQYKLDVISQYGDPDGEGWYNAGSIATVSVNPPNDFLIQNILDGWEGHKVELAGNSARLIVDSPTTITAKWKTDYSQIILIGIIPVGVGIAYAVKLRRNKSKKSVVFDKIEEEISRSEESPQFNNNYLNEIKEYQLQKSIEKLDLMRDSGLLNETRHTQIKEKLESDN